MDLLEKDAGMKIVFTLIIFLTACSSGDGRDGTNGVNGLDGVSPALPNNVTFITDIVDPCGQESQFDEVILVLSDGSLLAHYSHGNRQFLVRLSDGDYVTTDGTGCHFSIHNGQMVPQ